MMTKKLYLAPMEGLGDRTFRTAIATIGGFDEACTEFIRVPKNAHIRSLAKVYDSKELGGIPLAAQIMGDNEPLLAAMTQELIEKGAPRIDLNCGCPSNIVVGRGAGSSLLKDPIRLHRIISAMTEVGRGHGIPVTVKVRSGYEDTALFDDNIRAVEDAGAHFITIHPRTKVEGYKPPANWDLIARAKEILSIPVIGNGDIATVDDAIRMFQQTGCDGIMIGRGAVADPWIFQRIRQHQGRSHREPSWEGTESYIRYFAERTKGLRERVQINKLKQLINYLFADCPEIKKSLLRGGATTPAAFLETVIAELKALSFESC